MTEFDSVGDYYNQAWQDHQNGDLPPAEPGWAGRYYAPQTPRFKDGLYFECLPVENIWMPDGAAYDRGLINRLADDMEHCGGLPFVVPVFPAPGQDEIYISSPHPTAIAAVALMQKIKMTAATFHICPDLAACEAVSNYLPDFNQLLHDLLPQLFETIQAGRLYASDADAIYNAIGAGDFKVIFPSARFWAGQLDGYDRLEKLQAFLLLVSNGEENLIEITEYLEDL